MSFDPSVFTGLGLPSSVVTRIKNRAAETILLAILRQGLAGVAVHSKVPQTVPDLFLLVRKVPDFGIPSSRRNPTLDHVDFMVQVYAEDPNGDEKGALVCDAAVDVFDQAFKEHWSFPNIGIVNYIDVTQDPSRMTDWANSVGPVQYADLPLGNWRYEARFTGRFLPPR